MTFDRLEEAAAFIALATGRAEHHVALILGSGLGEYAGSLPDAVSLPYETVPGLVTPSVEGHTGTLVSAQIGRAAVLALAGRSHLFEGRPMHEIVFGVRAAIRAGCRIVVLTNAVGALGRGLAPGDLVLITDHLNLTGSNPLIGENDPRLGPRFPDLSELYSVRLRDLARQAAADARVALAEGIYAWMTGPSYETPAEIRMVATLGGDLVGMSTVPEAIAARHMGAEVLGISLVTNMAAGLSSQPLTHEEVRRTAEKARDRFTRLLDALLPRLAGSR